MPDSARSVTDFDVAPSNGRDRRSISPPLSLSSSQQYDSPSRGADQDESQSQSQSRRRDERSEDPRAGAADATNSTAEPELTLFPFDIGQTQDPPSPVHAAEQQPESQSQSLTFAESNAAPLNQAPSPSSLGSQQWTLPFSPYLDIHHLAYEPQGELLREQVDSFNEFNTPPPIQAAGPRSPSGIDPQSSASPKGVPSVNAPTPSAILAPPPAPKSSLKRKAGQALNLPSEPGSIKKKTTAISATGKDRCVRFGRMSNPSLSPSQESAVPSDFAPDDASTQGQLSYAKHPRRRRPSDPDSPHRPSVKIPSGGSQRSGQPPPVNYPKGTGLPKPSILPPEKVFPIQIGSDLFRLSGASISSDAPSYFTHFFEDQVRQNAESGGVRTLYIDRDPVTFRDIARHLQGYNVKPADGSHFVKLFADAQFYSLPRLIDQLFESEIFIQIGDRHFQIPKDIFSGPGDSPNFFSLGFAVFFSTPGDVFPGLDRRGLLRPPSIAPPCVPSRSADIFAELLHLLRGYPLHIRDEIHRAELLRDCRYFHLRGLEQKLIAHEISYNLERQRSEICIRLEDVKPSGVSFLSDVRSNDNSIPGGWVNYARPFIDDNSYELILEIGGEYTILDLDNMRADFHGLAKARVSSLFQVVANKMNLPTNAPLGLMMLSGGPSAQGASPGHTPLSEDRVKIRIEQSTDIRLDGEPYEMDWTSLQRQSPFPPPVAAAVEKMTDSDALSDINSTRSASRQSQRDSGTRPSQTSRALSGVSVPKKRKHSGSLSSPGDWVVRSGQWRLRVQSNPLEMARGGLEIVFVAVKIDAYTGERARNARRGFLS